MHRKVSVHGHIATKKVFFNHFHWRISRENQNCIFQEIQVEFEARNPDASDFNGIRRLLQQVCLSLK